VTLQRNQIPTGGEQVEDERHAPTGEESFETGRVEAECPRFVAGTHRRAPSCRAGVIRGAVEDGTVHIGHDEPAAGRSQGSEFPDGAVLEASKVRQIDPVVRQVGPSFGAIASVTAKTETGLVIVNVWESAERVADFTSHPDVQAARDAADLPTPSSFQRYEAGAIELFPHRANERVNGYSLIAAPAALDSMPATSLRRRLANVCSRAWSMPTAELPHPPLPSWRAAQRRRLRPA
jgi:hypothetical protein